MFRHAVTLVGLKTIARTVLGERAHQAITRDLGDDERRRYRHDQAVAADHGFAFAGRIDPVAAIDEYMFGHFGERPDGARQRPERSAKNVVAIDPRCGGESDGKRRRCADFLKQFLAALGGQTLGIIDTLWNTFGVQHDSRCHHWTRQRSSAGLVTARHGPDPAFDQRALTAKAWWRYRDDDFRQLG